MVKNLKKLKKYYILRYLKVGLNEDEFPIF